MNIQSRNHPTEIVYYGVNRWESLIQREQHLIAGLSRTYRVLFVDPPLSYLTVFGGKVQGRKLAFKSKVRWVNDRLIVYSPPAFPPFSQYSRWVNSFHCRLLIALTQRLLERLSFKKFILGIARPFLSGVVEGLGAELSYYDCADDYLEFPALRARKKMLRRSEEELLKSVDLVFCSSRGLVESKSPSNGNCFLIPNGVDLASFRDLPNLKGEIPSGMEEIKKPILGYIGTIGEWFDFEVLLGVASARPDWSIVLVGPSTVKRISSIFGDLRNVYWMGEKDYDELYKYLGVFDVCLIPFQVNEFTQKIYPTKIHQYLAAGKPVVSSPLPELLPFAPPVEFYSTSEEMEVKIEKSLREDSENKVRERRRIAGENTWDQRVESMIRIFHQFLSQRETSRQIAQDTQASKRTER